MGAVAESCDLRQSLLQIPKKLKNYGKIVKIIVDKVVTVVINLKKRGMG